MYHTRHRYQFPYWSQTSHWPGQNLGDPKRPELGGPTGACFVGLIPYTQVKKSPATANFGAATANLLEDM